MPAGRITPRIVVGSEELIGTQECRRREGERQRSRSSAAVPLGVCSAVDSLLWTFPSIVDWAAR
eukprot:5596075-Prymnesium_polylepis.1